MQEQKPITTVGFFPSASTVFSPLTRQAGWLLFGLTFLVQKAGAVFFTHNGNNYKLELANGTASNNTIAASVFQAVVNGTFDGDCGAVTVPQNPPTAWNSSWTQSICDGAIVLSRQAAQVPHVVFEECEKNITNTEIDAAKPHCDDRKQADAFTIAAFTFLGVTCAILLLAIFFKCILRCTAPSDYKTIDNRKSPAPAGL